MKHKNNENKSRRRESCNEQQTPDTVAEGRGNFVGNKALHRDH